MYVIRYTGVFSSTLHMRGVRKVLQVDMLDWKTFQNLYTNKTYVSPKHVWA